MSQRSQIPWLLLSLLLIISSCFGQSKKPMANQFSVHIFSSANFMGYLEPCG